MFLCYACIILCPFWLEYRYWNTSLIKTCKTAHISSKVRRKARRISSPSLAAEQDYINLSRELDDQALSRTAAQCCASRRGLLSGAQTPSSDLSPTRSAHLAAGKPQRPRPCASGGGWVPWLAVDSVSSTCRASGVAGSGTCAYTTLDFFPSICHAQIVPLRNSRCTVDNFEDSSLT